MKCYITPMRMTTIKRKAITSVSENVDKWEPSYIAVKYVKCFSYFRKWLGSFKCLKIYLSLYIFIYISNIHIAKLFIVDKT